MWRRSFNFICAALGLLALSPLLLVIAALIRLDDGGPVLFTQMRLGRDRRPFRIYKFRSMRNARVTRIGRRLRATGLDELPQLVNLLLGDMCLLGPRPLTAADVERLGWDDDAHALRWRVTPGIAGLAQIYAGRGARSSWFLDCRYVQARSPRMDFDIVLLAGAMCVLGKPRVRGWLRANRRLGTLRAGHPSPTGEGTDDDRIRLSCLPRAARAEPTARERATRGASRIHGGHVLRPFSSMAP